MENFIFCSVLWKGFSAGHCALIIIKKFKAVVARGFFCDLGYMKDPVYYMCATGLNFGSSTL